MFQFKGFAISGLYMKRGVYVKERDGTFRQLTDLVCLNEAGIPSRAIMVLNVPNEVVLSNTTDVGELSSGVTYTLRGTAYPTDVAVKLKTDDGQSQTVIPAEDGTFSIENLEGTGTTAQLVQELDVKSIAAAMNCNLSVEKVATVQEEKDVAMALIPEAEVSVGDFYFAMIHVTGICSNDVTSVHVSKLPATPCPTCNGLKGTLIKEGCNHCGGTGTISAGNCPVCDATGILSEGPCPVCGGNAMQEDGSRCSNCCDGHVYEGSSCPVCSGTGRLDTDMICPSCSGSGVTTVLEICSYCGGSGADPASSSTCGMCNGSGMRRSLTPCETCDGIGVIPSEFVVDDLYSNEVAVIDSAGGAFEFDFQDTSYSSHDHVYVLWIEKAADSSYVALNGFGSAGGICLAGETMISLADGTEKRLDELDGTEMVLSGDGTPTAIARRQRGTFSAFHTLYTFEDGIVIDEIQRHRFYNVEQGFWQMLERWNLGEHAVRQDGTHVALISVQRVQETKERFGLWTKSGDYYANGLLTGETAVNHRLLANASVEKAVEMASSLSERTLLALTGLEGILP